MNISAFFEHWGLSENPFRAEEARQDVVFERLGAGPTTHPDFEKILGSVERPSTSIVFGEKGSGKTAIRMQIAQRVERHNEGRDDGKALFIAYDDLNPFLDRLHAREGGKDPGEALKTHRLHDHIDALMRLAVAPLVDAALKQSSDKAPGVFPENTAQLLRRAPAAVKRDAMALQVVYDRPEAAAERSFRFRRRIGAPRDRQTLLWSVAAGLGWVFPVAAILTRDFWEGLSAERGTDIWMGVSGALAGLWALVVFKRWVWDRLLATRLAGKIRGQVRVLDRSVTSLRASLGALPRRDRAASVLPSTGSDDTRYAMLERLLRVLGALGFTGVIIVVDRVDEPTLVSGDPDRMRGVVWPLLNNKFLQCDGVGVKLLLPIELRHALMRESSAFFQEARLDKQSFIEQLAWTGATLHDLCDDRLRACAGEGREGGALGLQDLFEDDVSRQDLVDALDQMRQPRDAFKMLYQCIQDHCASVTSDQAAWRIPRHVLESVRRQQAERVSMLYRGVRPA